MKQETNIEDVNVEEIATQDFYVLLYKMKGNKRKWWSLGVYENSDDAISSAEQQIESKVVKFTIDI